MKKKNEKKYYSDCLKLVETRITFIDEKRKNDPTLKNLFFHLGGVYCFNKKGKNITNELDAIYIIPFETSIRNITNGILADISMNGVELNVEAAMRYLLQTRRELLDKNNGASSQNNKGNSSKVKTAIPSTKRKRSPQKRKRHSRLSRVSTFIKVGLNSPNGEPKLKDLSRKMLSEPTWSRARKDLNFLNEVIKELIKYRPSDENESAKIDDLKEYVSILKSKAQKRSIQKRPPKTNLISLDNIPDISNEDILQ